MKESKKIGKDLLWNYMSIAVMAAVGLLMNAVIAVSYGGETLGCFNETYAWYMILSQIAVWGIHMAMVKYVPETAAEETKGTFLRTGIVVVFLISVGVTLVSEIAVLCMKAAPWGRMMSIAFSSLVLLSINKVCLSYLNATNRMTVYAALVSLRYFGLGLSTVILSAVHIDSDWLALVFPVSEMTLWVVIMLYFATRIRIKGRLERETGKKLLSFGSRILPSNLVLELNTKVDVICLGLLITDMRKIGIYSFAILFTEGFYMLYVIIRKLINPSLSESNIQGKIEIQIHDIRQKMKGKLILGGTSVLVCVLIVYLSICAIMDRSEYQVGIVYISIICVAMIVNGKSIIFGDLLAQIGFPSEESFLNILTVGYNFVVNLIMIKTLGVIGAAISTATSYFVYSYYLRTKVRKRTGLIL